MKNPWVIIVAIAVVLFGGAFWYASVSSEKNNEGVEIVSHTKGSPESTITLVEYSDLQCPACAAFQPAVEEVIESYGDTILFEYKHFPLPIHQYAVQAAVAAEAAGQQGKFFEYHDLLFANQGEWDQTPTPRVQFLQYAEELELDMEKFRRHMNSSLLRERVQNDFAEGRELGVTGTPTFFLNGKLMDFKTFEEFFGLIDAVAAGEVSTTTPSAGADIEFGI